jgi:hypothetical protein
MSSAPARLQSQQQQQQQRFQSSRSNSISSSSAFARKRENTAIFSSVPSSSEADSNEEKKGAGSGTSTAVQATKKVSRVKSEKKRFVAIRSCFKANTGYIIDLTVKNFNKESKHTIVLSSAFMQDVGMLGTSLPIYIFKSLPLMHLSLLTHSLYLSSFTHLLHLSFS